MFKIIVLFLAGLATAAAQWSLMDFTDEFGEVTDKGARSALAKPKQALGPPYSDLQARIVVDCEKVWIRFSKTPVLQWGNPQRVAVRLDGGKRDYWPVKHTIGQRDVRFAFGQFVLQELSAANVVDIAVPWHLKGAVVFSWSLKGSATAIQKSCDSESTY